MLQATPSWSALLSGKNAIYSLALCGGVGLDAVNILMATTILPSVVKDIGGLDYYAWSTTLFVLASILGAALSAKLLQSTGPRGAYGVAALVFAAGTVICALAPSMPVMLVGRFVQGFGGGFLYALAYAVIRLVFPEPLWARAIGLISAMWGVATLVGPAIGGVFAEVGAWRVAFWSLVPFVLLFALSAFVALPVRRADHLENSPVPLTQLVLLTACVLALSAGSVAPEPLWNAAGLAGALVLLALLVAAEARAEKRLLPKSALNVAAPLCTLYATIALLVIGIQPEVFAPYFLQVLHGQSPLIAGYLGALMAVGWTLASMLSASLSGDATRRAIVAGPIAIVLGMAMLAAFLPIHGAGALTVLVPACIGLALVGFGIGLAWPHLVKRVFQAAPVGEQDLAAGAITTVQLFITAMGTAAAGMAANIAGLSDPGGVPGAQSAALWVFAAFALTSVLGIPIAIFAARFPRCS
jgi:MFS family permease